MPSTDTNTATVRNTAASAFRPAALAQQPLAKTERLQQLRLADTLLACKIRQRARHAQYPVTGPGRQSEPRGGADQQLTLWFFQPAGLIQLTGGKVTIGPPLARLLQGHGLSHPSRYRGTGFTAATGGVEQLRRIQRCHIKLHVEAIQ